MDEISSVVVVQAKCPECSMPYRLSPAGFYDEKEKSVLDRVRFQCPFCGDDHYILTPDGLKDLFR